MGQLESSKANTRQKQATSAAPVHGSRRLGSYLRDLREGYGYTLRKVEEHAVAMGEAIDNSQLSRFEKGKAVPSFDKLRALARVFNVPVQNFSDVLDLEEYRDYTPESEDYQRLLGEGRELLSRGEAGRALVTYERALELASEIDEPDKRLELAAEARWRMARCLKSLGKLYMTERELREILKARHRLPRATRLRTLLQLAYLYRELGDYYLATVLAKESLDLARREGDLGRQAGVLNTLGNIQQDEGRYERAIESYEQAHEVLEQVPGHEEMTVTVMTNLGGCLVGTGEYERALDLLRRAHGRARQSGYRRIAALALTWIAEAWKRRGEYGQAREHLSESDALASRTEGYFHDILFLNAFHRWEIARDEENSTGEKIAFGRLRHLRSLLQRRFPEVEAFDRHIQRIRR